MSKVIKLRRGFDIKLIGAAEKKLMPPPNVSKIALRPLDFYGVVPRLLIQEGDSVQIGTPLFFDKLHPAVIFSSPVSGRVSNIVRGEKRRIEAVIVESDGKDNAVDFGMHDIEGLSRDTLKKLLLKSGLWPLILQRPFGVIANQDITPRSIFVSGFDSAPLAPDTEFVLGGEKENVQAGFDALSLLTDGKVHLSLRAGYQGILSDIKGVEKHFFEGPHPAGNIGVQINHIDPIRKGDTIWTLRIEDVMVMGRLLRGGKVDTRRYVALTGSGLRKPCYAELVAGANIGDILRGLEPVTAQRNNYRIISGNVLTGTYESAEGYMGFYDNQITVIPEGDYYEMLGWIRPRINKFSTSRSYFSWLMPRRKYDLDTNLNGGPRAFVMTDIYDKYLPMDIYAMYLIKACMAGDIDKMENLGIYEVLPEDFALCEFVDPSKTDIQAVIRKGIDLMVKEMS